MSLDDDKIKILCNLIDQCPNLHEYIYGKRTTPIKNTVSKSLKLLGGEKKHYFTLAYMDLREKLRNIRDPKDEVSDLRKLYNLTYL
jgi:hypothetical protein